MAGSLVTIATLPPPSISTSSSTCPRMRRALLAGERPRRSALTPVRRLSASVVPGGAGGERGHLVTLRMTCDGGG